VYRFSALTVLLLTAACAQPTEGDEGPFTRPQALLPDGNAPVLILDSDGADYNGLGVGADGALYLATGEYRLKEEVEGIDQEKFEGADLLYTEITIEVATDDKGDLEAFTFVMGAKDFDSEFDGVAFQVDCFEMDPPDDLDKYGVYWETLGKLEDGTALEVTFSGSQGELIGTGVVEGTTVSLKSSVSSKGIEGVTFSL